jgi:hypothetical protein
MGLLGPWNTLYGVIAVHYCGEDAVKLLMFIQVCFESAERIPLTRRMLRSCAATVSFRKERALSARALWRKACRI